MAKKLSFIFKRLFITIWANRLRTQMQHFQISQFLQISGIGAASGIVNYNKSLYIISDSASFLYQYQLERNILIKHSLIANASENIIKKEKPDFEAITLHKNNLHIYGSGSTKNRCQSPIFDVTNNQVVLENKSDLYNQIKKTAQISSEELNIEGAFFYQEKLYLLQRGNGINAKNGIILVHNNTKIEYSAIDLPKIKHVITSFTDAILVDKTVYFLASAEDSASTYEDGEVLGSIIGAINIETYKVEFTLQISNNQKFEGLTLHSSNISEINFLLCEDNDTETLQTTIYKLKLTK